MQRLYHHDGDKASAKAADKFGTFYSMSTMANNTIEEISNISGGPKLLKALSLGAKACAGGRLYLYALAAAGQAGVERALGQYKAELQRNMKLMGCTKISDLNRSNLRFRR